MTVRKRLHPGGGVSTVVATPTGRQGRECQRRGADAIRPTFRSWPLGARWLFRLFAAEVELCQSGGSYSFEIFYGTSAAAPGMAGIAALLDQKLGVATGQPESATLPDGNQHADGIPRRDGREQRGG